MIFKPMLAGKAPSFDKIKYPVLATPKLDGIRCVVVNGKALSRSLKPIPNLYTRCCIENHASLVNGYDGELIIAGQPFNAISSAIMSISGEPVFEYWVFDIVTQASYDARMSVLFSRKSNGANPWFVKFVLPSLIKDEAELLDYEAEKLREGYEGVMIRSLDGPYKYGRSTEKEGWLLKIKRFEDAEAEIVGVEELMHNENPAFEGELGQTKRSTCQYGQVAGGTMGALIVKDIKTEVLFKIGTGFSEIQRAEFWEKRHSVIGQLVKYKSQPHGKVDKPRSPVFIGLRDKSDL